MAVLLKCSKGKMLPDNHVKLTYKTVKLSPPQLLGNETYSDIIKWNRQPACVFERANC